MEQGLAGLAIGTGTVPMTTPTPAVQVTTRTKDSRYKGKRAYPSIPNQPSEAGAHFMFELAKTVLTKAGGNSSTSLFTQPSSSQNHHGPHRALHMCAFQLGLYALGLHNCVSPNWLSRTYSSHVSWTTGKWIFSQKNKSSESPLYECNTYFTYVCMYVYQFDCEKNRNSMTN